MFLSSFLFPAGKIRSQVVMGRAKAAILGHERILKISSMHDGAKG